MNYTIDISNTVLRTGRLILRPWRENDLENLFRYASVDGVGQMAGWLPHKDIEESGKILRMFMDSKSTFCIEYEGRAVGSLGIDMYDEKQFPEFNSLRCREIGYVLAKECWGKGLMTEAVKEVIRYLFEEEGLDCIFCGHFLRNAVSARVQEKCGFKHYRFTEYETFMGTVEDNEINILTREDWEKYKIVR
ncbi:MAG: GNAT family N-acetyltransferase [Oscillospiraceae bacterium]|nr:GNAT family N-acetyltransferase [Oscillospiraceae bacterium]